MYVDANYYKNVYKGTTIPDEQLENILEASSDQIDILTFNRISAIGFNDLTPFQQDKIKKAVCVQADFISMYGAYIDLPLSGYSAGSVSVNLGNGANGVSAPNSVLNYLRQTGLSNRIV